MFLTQRLFNSSNISLNAANLSVRHCSCFVPASLKDINALMKTRRLSRLRFRKFCPGNLLAYEIPKKQEALPL